MGDTVYDLVNKRQGQEHEEHEAEEHEEPEEPEEQIQEAMNEPEERGNEPRTGPIVGASRPDEPPCQ